ncbi:MAG TPA: 1,4-alpha-glucan branching protein GlgB [Steroidobacteraceae bacterium]
MTPSAAILASLDADLRRIASGQHHDPHGVLGPHLHGAQQLVLVYRPSARSVRLDRRHAMAQLRDPDFFAWSGPPGELAKHYLVSWVDQHGMAFEQHDAYSFECQISPENLQRFGTGAHLAAWRFLGSHACTVDGVSGTRFAVWAPNAGRVSVVGPFCQWDGRRYPMRVLGQSGVWEIFVPGIGADELYKFEVRNRETGAIFLKSDPFARATELRPATASLVARDGEADSGFAWSDGEWLQARASRDWLHAPMSIYEVHPGSWQRRADGGFLSYDELAEHLVPYVKRLGFTHVELMPITEFPLDDSWGYQTTGYFAPTSRHGTPDGLRHFIDRCHASGIGVLLDWVPGHFPRDAHGLANFDGNALYEYADPHRAEHRDWGTLVFNYERHEVRSFLLSSACYWLDEFHFDGLRVDAVASMLYLDFSRRAEDFVPNKLGGNQSLEAIDFLRTLNATTHARHPGTLVIAEESTDWPLVSRPTDVGGLGFSMKWNMGWMHDTLAYFREDPLYRAHHHHRLTFGMMYAYSENFVLPLSHDEVVHLKRSLLGKMPGDHWQRLANLRLLFTYQWTFPGKKLLFMGGELAQPTEWDFRGSLPWHLEKDAGHAGVQRVVCDLNRLYASAAPLHRYEFEPQGFRWIDCEDRARSVISYLRTAGEEALVVVLNFTPVPRYAYRIGVPQLGEYREIFNSDSEYYGGSNVGNLASVQARAEPYMGFPCSIDLTLPPLAGIVLAVAQPAPLTRAT